MKRSILILSLLLVTVFISACGLIQIAQSTKPVTPSDVTVTEERAVAGFTEIDMSTFGKVTITQGDNESLVISGSDNIVELIETSVRGDTLTIRAKENFSLNNFNRDDVLTIDITVKDLTGLTLSGLGDVSMDSLSTTSLEVEMSGAGQLVLDDLQAESVDVTVSGLGSVEIGGKVTRQTVSISGAGEVSNDDLESEEANVSVPGLGNATVWVTGQLDGKISGAGSVSYYGSPSTNLETPGLGDFKALGSR